MGLHLDPFNYELRSRIDTVKQRLGGKKAVSMCKWRGNMFTQTHEISTALGIAHASANRIAESLVFFFSSVSETPLQNYAWKTACLQCPGVAVRCALHSFVVVLDAIPLWSCSGPSSSCRLSVVSKMHLPRIRILLCRCTVWETRKDPTQRKNGH